MSETEIESIVSDFRKNVCEISDEEVGTVLDLCSRKMKLTGKNEDYLAYLFPDELKNHVFRNAVNATTILRQIGKECAECAACV